MNHTSARARELPPLTSAERLYGEYLLAPPEAREDFEELCARHEGVADELRAIAARWSEVFPGSSPAPVSAEFALKVIARHADLLEALGLAEGSAPPAPEGEPLVPCLPRYEIERELGRGGMGAVFRAHDRNLGRPVAMKVLLASSRVAPEARASTVSPGRLNRFLAEAQITGQLDHPGIVPVHELGVDDEDRVYFTMRLVRGRDLAEVFRLTREEREGWNLARLLGVLLAVGETVGYAHSRGVVHRDLKPSNVFVDRFGEAYVMDWGLARVEVGEEAPADPIELDTRCGGDGGSPLATADGAVLGTPAYMPPEQALGLVEALAPRADVYALGALLYHALTGTVPFKSARTPSTPREVVEEIVMHRPKPVLELAPRTPPELVAICEKAMAHEASERYVSPLEMAEDLRAFLDGRPVRAHASGPWTQLSKWIGRNRAFAASLLAVILVGLAVLVGVTKQQLVRARALENLSASVRIEDLRRTVESSENWVARPSRVEKMEEWLEGARAIEAELPRHRERREELGRELGLEPGAESPSSSSLFETSRERVETLWEYRTHDDILAKATELLGEEGPREVVVADLAWAERVRSESIDEHFAEWVETIDEIAASSKYGGLGIPPQLGLVPLGFDPDSGLAEFAHLLTARRATPDAPAILPVRGADGRFDPSEDLPAIFVLIPGGRAWMGAVRPDPDHPVGAPRVDPQAFPDEAPLHEVPLEPFFLSKYELTRAQYDRLVAAKRGRFGASSVGDGAARPDDPAASLHEAAVRRLLKRYQLTPPTEVQWEYAARAGTTTVWHTGDDAASLDGFANLLRDGNWMDPFEGVAPVGSFRPNAFGLHDVHGNVAELCLDPHGTYFLLPEKGSGHRHPRSGETAVRGGGFASPPCRARSAWRGDHGGRGPAVGIRPARSLELDVDLR